MAYISKETVISHIEGVYEKLHLDHKSRQLIAALKAYIESLPTKEVEAVKRGK